MTIHPDSPKTADSGPLQHRGGRSIRRCLAVLSALALVLLVDMTGGIATASAHGATTRPGSRTYLCRIDGTHASGDINPSNAACGAAVALGGKQPLWDWFGVLRSEGAGRTRGYIPDGQLCSGGEPKYAGYDLPRDDWPYTRLTSGADLAVRYNAWAAHPGDFRLYVTKDGFDPNQPLGWDDLEDQPFSVYNQNSPNGTDEQNGTPDYQWNVKLPNKSGQHIIYSVWSRSDSNETFYGCSDVRFDGGTGQVVGVGAGANPVGAPNGGAAPVTPTPSTEAPTPTTTATPTPAPTTVSPGAATSPSIMVDNANGRPQPGQSAPPTSQYGTETTAGAATAAGQGVAETQPDAEQMAADGAGTDGTSAGVAGTVASTDGAVIVTPQQDPQETGMSAEEFAELETVALGNNQPLPAVQSGAASGGIGGDSTGGGMAWVAIIATALAGLAVGVVLSIAVYSSPRARNLYRRVLGFDEITPLVPMMVTSPPPLAPVMPRNATRAADGRYGAAERTAIGSRPSGPLAVTSHR